MEVKSIKSSRNESHPITGGGSSSSTTFSWGSEEQLVSPPCSSQSSAACHLVSPVHADSPRPTLAGPVVSAPPSASSEQNSLPFHLAVSHHEVQPIWMYFKHCSQQKLLSAEPAEHGLSTDQPSPRVWLIPGRTPCPWISLRLAFCTLLDSVL